MGYKRDASWYAAEVRKSQSKVINRKELWNPTEKNVESIVKYLDCGLSFKDSCNLALVPFEIVKIWIEKGSKDIIKKTELLAKDIDISDMDVSREEEFCLILREKDSQLHKRALDVVVQHMENNDKDGWKAATWLLDKKYSETYKQKSENTQNNNLKVEFYIPNKKSESEWINEENEPTIIEAVDTSKNN